jgi:molybdopterin-guanine dinucleotide biosynthesis protein A
LIPAAIVAGGHATRLGGVAKGTLVVGGRRIVDRQLEVLRGAFSRVFLVANDASPWRDLGLDVVPDLIPGAGPLAGIDAALAALGPGEEAVVCVAGDMPFLTPQALALLRDHPPGGIVAARVAGRPEPLFARYARECHPALQAALAAGHLAAGAFLDGYPASYLDEAALRVLDPSLRFLTNVNTPEDLQAHG